MIKYFKIHRITIIYNTFGWKYPNSKKKWLKENNSKQKREFFCNKMSENKDYCERLINFIKGEYKLPEKMKKEVSKLKKSEQRDLVKNILPYLNEVKNYNKNKLKTNNKIENKSAIKIQSKVREYLKKKEKNNKLIKYNKKKLLALENNEKPSNIYFPLNNKFLDNKKKNNKWRFIIGR